MSRPCKRSDYKTERNLEIFWAIHRDGLTQDQAAAVFGVTQQRVSAIVRKTALFVALAPSEEYDHIPQMGQLQYGHRIWMKKLEARRVKLVKAFDESMKPVTSLKELDEWQETPQQAGEGGKEGKSVSRHYRKETTAKSQHGDWRIDRQIEGIDKALFESRILCYGRPWKGWEELAAMPKPKRKAKRGKEEEMRNAELGMRNEGEHREDMVDGAVPSTEYSVLGTATVVAEVAPSESAVAEPSAEPLAAADSALSTDSAFPIPNSALPKKPPPPISKITGKRFLAPRQETAETLLLHGLNPDDYGAVPAAVMYDTTPRWITGPDPREVLLRDVSAMTDEEYEQHLRDVAWLDANGVYLHRDTRPVITLVEGPTVG